MNELDNQVLDNEDLNQSEELNQETEGQELVGDNESEAKEDTDNAEDSILDESKEEPQDSEIPEWVARRLKRQKSSNDRVVSELKAQNAAISSEMEKLLSFYRASNPQQNMQPNIQAQNLSGVQQPYAQQPYDQQPSYPIKDPETGQFVDSNSPEGHRVLNYLNMQNSISRRQEQEVFQEKKHAFVQDFNSRLEEASESDEKLIPILTKQKESGNISEDMINVLEVMPNSVRVLSQLAKKGNELERISKLHKLEQARELGKHLYNLGVQDGYNKKPSKAPKATGSLGRSSSTGPTSGSMIGMNKDQIRDFVKNYKRR